jgi:hypothetical protein
MKKSWIYYEMHISSVLSTEGNAALNMTPLYIAKRTAGSAGR